MKTQVGIIGGGQLGLFLVRSAMQFPVAVSVYDPNPKCPASHFAPDFTVGGFDDYEKKMVANESYFFLIIENYHHKQIP